MEKPTKKFSINARKFFVTLNKTEQTKEIVAQKLKERYREQIKCLIIARETYKENPGHHIHIGIEFNKKKRITNHREFDNLFTKTEVKRGAHASIESMKGTMQETEKYLRKEDTDPLIVGEIEADQKKEKLTDEIAKMIMEGKDDEEITLLHPGFMMMNSKRIDDFRKKCEMWKERKKEVTWKILQRTENMSQEEKDVQDWLNQNILQERVHKQQQLFITGFPNSGKTLLVNVLESQLRIFHMPTQEQFYDGWKDDAYDLIVFDEWNQIHHQHSWLMKLLEGGPNRMRSKGGSTLKRNRVPIIILTNYQWNQLYPDGEKKIEGQAMEARILKVDLVDQLTQEKISLRMEKIFPAAMEAAMEQKETEQNQSPSQDQERTSDLLTSTHGETRTVTGQGTSTTSPTQESRSWISTQGGFLRDEEPEEEVSDIIEIPSDDDITGWPDGNFSD